MSMKVGNPFYTQWAITYHEVVRFYKNGTAQLVGVAFPGCLTTRHLGDCCHRLRGQRSEDYRR
jgi:hypothetical protein